MKLDGEDGRPLVYNRRCEVVTTRHVRAAIMRELRLVASVYTLEQRASAVTRLLGDPRWLSTRSGQYLGSVARDGFYAAFTYLHEATT